MRNILDKKLHFPCFICLGVFLSSCTAVDSCKAQVAGDNTLSTSVTTLDNRQFSITGGTKLGGNLFHSFAEFSVPEGGAVVFFNGMNVQNIFARVTGGPSYIDGSIGTRGGANLFLLNPRGITFGVHSRLEVGGSFIATTAARVDFADGKSFVADSLAVETLLTASIPVGLHFRGDPAPIINNSRFRSDREAPVGLQVRPGKTLALVGGDIFFDGGVVSVGGGRIELGSVGGESTVSLTALPEGWVLGYENVTAFGDIRLDRYALLKVEGSLKGDVSLRGENISIVGASGIKNSNEGDTATGTIALKATRSVEIIGGSTDVTAINSSTDSSGPSGDIIIETERLLVRGYVFIDTSSQNLNNGRGGNLNILASESVEVDGEGGISKLTTQTFSNNDAGDLNLTTKRLYLRDGGQIDSSASDGGTVSVAAPEGDTVSVAASEGGTGRAGNIYVKTRSLLLDGGSITAETSNSGIESKGNIFIEASNLSRMENESVISATANGSANGGNININTPLLLVTSPTGPNGSDIIAKAERGNGGEIRVTTASVFGVAEGKAIEGNQSNDIDARSESGARGLVRINTDTDTDRGLIQLPAIVVDTSGLIDQNVCRRGSHSQLTRSGRGGSPPNPTEDVTGAVTAVGLVEPAPATVNEAPGEKVPASAITGEGAVIPAMGWVSNDRGEVILVAHDPTATSLSRQF